MSPPTAMYPIIKGTFTITYILLVTTGIIIFIEALRAGASSFISHVMNLETAISVVASYFYGLFVKEFEDAEKHNVPIDWEKMTTYRYVDWSITTPIMLLVLCMFLANNLKIPVQITTYIYVIVLNYIMLLFGYLGETENIDKNIGLMGGFAAFFMLYGIIYAKFIRPKNILSNNVLFYFYLVVWSIYGLVYYMDDGHKIVATNVLDLVSKCFVGLGLWAHYTKILAI